MKEKEAFVRYFREAQPKYARLCLRNLCRAGLTMPQYTLLHLLSNGSVPMTDLSERLHVTKPAVTNLVDRLEKPGFLRRTADKKDRRVTLIEIRSKGMKLVRNMQSTILGFLLPAFEDFSPTERATIVQFYEKLSSNMEEDLSAKTKKGSAKTSHKWIVLGLVLLLSWGSAQAAEMKSPQAADTLNFENFIRAALSRSEEIKQSSEDIAIARARTFQAFSQAIGTGDFVITHNFQERQNTASAGGSDVVSSTSNAPHRRTREFSFTQPLFQGFKSLGAIMGAGSLKSQRHEEQEWTKEKIFIAAADAFYALLSAERDLGILDETAKLFSDRINELSEREKIGRSRAGELSQARAKMKVVEARIARARGTLLSAQSLASYFTGISHPKVEDEDPETFSQEINLDPEHYAALAAQRPDVEAARQAARVAKQAIVVKQSGFWPSLSLGTNHYEKRQGFQAGITWDAVLTFDVPLYRGGDNIGQLLEAKANYKKAQLQYEWTQKQALLEIEQAHQNWIAARAEHTAYREAVKAEEENFKYQKDDYAHNLVSNLDVLTALEEFLATREDANGVEYDMKTNYWKLQMAISRNVPEWAEADRTTNHKPRTTNHALNL